ncbi:5-oxoprolinase subunit PxpB [Ornithinibacillus sp. FSL M8-0202]|uniref:5-oxoprolinase subunit PxpB n=1 Tax=Ornithinibacillus sp. FSL M8-0202 TaxID=2921616 RepID=UPI0030D16EAB
MNVTFSIAGDQSILVTFSRQHIRNETSKAVRKLAELVEQKKVVGMEEVILGYSSLLVHYNPMKITYESMLQILKELLQQIDLSKREQTNEVEIPVLYGGTLGPDLADVAHYHHLSEEEVIRIHTTPSYTVNFLGFTPGFPFLSGLSSKIATPRLANPRARIHAGSVGIANNQTGIYPVISPGGWRLIGHTPITLYDPQRNNPFLLSPGDRVTFKAITTEEYDQLIRQQQGGGSYI